MADSITPTPADGAGYIGDSTKPIFLPGLLTIANLLRAQLQEPQDARVLQAQNAPQCVAENQGTLTSSAPVTIAEAANRNRSFTFLVVVFTETAGKGRYSWLGKATAAGGGFPISSGGGSLVIYGSQNIATCAMIAETGETLPYTYGLFI